MTARPRPPLNSLEDDRDALPAADAGRGQAVATAAAAQLHERRQDEARARSAERVAERYRAAVDVRLRAVEAEFLLDGEVLAGEGLVDFDEVYVREFEARLLQGLADGGHGADAHQVGLDARVGPRDDAAQRLRAAAFHKLLARDDEHGRAVNDAGGVAGGDEAFTAEGGRQSRQDFERRVGAQVVV